MLSTVKMLKVMEIWNGCQKILVNVNLVRNVTCLIVAKKHITSVVELLRLVKKIFHAKIGFVVNGPHVAKQFVQSILLFSLI